MRNLIAASALSLVLACGMALQPAARAATPAMASPRPLSCEEATLLVLVTGPVLRDFSNGGTPVLGTPMPIPLERGACWIQVSSNRQERLGTYRVDIKTARVFDAAGRELHSPELEAAQRIVRQAHGIALITPAALDR